MLEPSLTEEQDLISAELLDDHRRKAHLHLESYVDYIKLNGLTKVPASSIKAAAQPKLPRVRNVGAIPRPGTRLVIFDLDKKPGSLSPDEQFERLVTELSLNPDTLRVRTPSGGLHIFLLWPEGVELPRNVKLAKVYPWLKGDVRGPVSVGYVVFAGSRTEQGSYLVAHEASLKEFPLASAEAFMAKINETKLQRMAKPAEEPREAPLPASEGTLGLTPASLQALRRLVRQKQRQSFHVKRAVVYRAISCCASDEAVIAAWRALNIDRDSHNSSFILTRYLAREVERLRILGAQAGTHSRFCPTGAIPLKAPDGTLREAKDFTIEPDEREEIYRAYREDALARMKARKHWRTPQAVAIDKVFQTLKSKRKNASIFTALALAIVEDFLQPWLNYGAKNVLLNEQYLARFYGVDRREIRAAKHLLLRKNIIRTSIKQLPGRTAAFVVQDEFIDAGVTKLLEGASLGEKKTLVVDWRLGMLFEAGTGEVSGEIGYARKTMEELLPELPGRLSTVTLYQLVIGRAQPEENSGALFIDAGYEPLQTFVDELEAAGAEELPGGVEEDSAFIREFLDDHSYWGPAENGDSPQLLEEQSLEDEHRPWGAFSTAEEAFEESEQGVLQEAWAFKEEVEAYEQSKEAKSPPQGLLGTLVEKGLEGLSEEDLTLLYAEPWGFQTPLVLAGVIDIMAWSQERPQDLEELLKTWHLLPPEERTNLWRELRWNLFTACAHGERKVPDERSIAFAREQIKAILVYGIPSLTPEDHKNMLEKNYGDGNSNKAFSSLERYAHLLREAP